AEEGARAIVGDGERDRCLVVAGGSRVRCGEDDKASLVVLDVLDAGGEDFATCKLGGAAGAGSGPAGGRDGPGDGAGSREGGFEARVRQGRFEEGLALGQSRRM